MKLKNQFTVPAPIEQAYAVLLDVERVAPCLPGAALDGGDGQTFNGSMTIKLGPVKSRFQGTVRIESSDDRARRAVMRAEAKDAGGPGTVAATITTQMHESAGGTLVTVETDLLISGPAAQFGRGVMQDVSGKLMRQFAETLAEEMQADPTTTFGAEDDGRLGSSALPAADLPAAIGEVEYEQTAVGRLPIGPAADAALAAVAAAAPAPPPHARPRRTAEVLDLGAASRDAVLKRVVAPAVVIALITLMLWRKRSS